MGKQAKKQRREQAALATTGGNWMQQSCGWPVYEVLLSEGWDKEGAIVAALVARQSPRSGKIATASFLVDLACLGVKSCYVRLFNMPKEYAVGIRERTAALQALQPATLDLVARIVATGEAYARQFGFSPDSASAQAELLIANANPEECDTPVPTGGRDGKTFFFAGPHDNAPRIIAQLTRVVGEGNFNVMTPMEAPPGADFLRG